MPPKDKEVMPPAEEQAAQTPTPFDTIEKALAEIDRLNGALETTKSGEQAAIDQCKVATDRAVALDEQVTTQARLIESMEAAVAEREATIAQLEEALTGPESMAAAGQPAQADVLDDLQLVKITDDLERGIHDDPFLHAETINFRNDSGYSAAVRGRAVASVERALAESRVGDKFENLPAFNPGNRLLVVVGLLGPANSKEE